MFIFKSTYKDLLNQLEHREKSICDQHKVILGKDREINLRDKHIVDLKESLKNARDLKDILTILTPMTFAYSRISDGSCELNLPANVVRVLPDYFGGEVMSHEANKVVVLSSNGEIRKVAYTKKKPDTGYSYVLVREKAEVPKKK